MDGGRTAPLELPSGGSSTRQFRLRQRRGLPEFSDLVLACRYHPWKTIAFGTITSTLFASLACLLVDATYRAESLVRVKQHQDVVYAPQTTRADDMAFVRAQEELATAPPVLSAALQDTELLAYAHYMPARDTVAWLKGHLTVDMQSGSEVLSIAATHPVPEVAQAMSVAITRAYIAEVTDRWVSDQERRQLELERAAREADRRLDQLWSELNDVANQVGTENSQALTIRDEIQLQAYRDYAQQLRALQLRGHELVSQLAEARQAAESSAQATVEVDVQAKISQSPDVIAAQRRLELVDEQIRSMRKIVASEDSPRLQRLLADREFHAGQLQLIVELVTPRVRQEVLEQTQGQAQASLLNLQKQIELNESEKEYLRKRLAEIDSGSLRTAENSGLQLEMARHAIDRQARLADGLWQSLEELKIERQSQSRVQLMQWARVPDFARYDKQLKAMAAVIATCWLVIVLGTGYFEWRSCTVRHTADVVEHTCFPVFGDVEQALKGSGRFKASLSHTTGAQQAASQILLAEKQGQPIPVFMVTSAIDSEPRHLLAIDLALAFAKQRRRTLLVDFDTSAARLSSELAQATTPGILHICAQRLDPHSLILAYQPAIDFLPLGNGNAKAAWIDPHSFADMLARLRPDYDAVIVCGPSILNAAEGLIYAAQVEQLVFTVQGGQSRWNELAHAEDAALHAGLNCFGSIIYVEQERPPRISSLPRKDSQTAVDAQLDSLSSELSAIGREVHQALSGQPANQHVETPRITTT